MLSILLKYGLGLGLLAWQVWVYWEPAEGIGLKEALQNPIHVTPLLLGILLCVTGMFLTFFRWFLLVRAQELPFTFYEAIRLGMLGYYFSAFLPGSVGGDLVKATFLAREQSRRTAAVATVVFDRGIGLCALVWILSLLGGLFWSTGGVDSLVAEPEARWAIKMVLIFAGGYTATSILVWVWLGSLSAERTERWTQWLGSIRRIGPSLAELWRVVLLYRQKGRYVAQAMGVALLGHVCFIGNFYCCASTLTSMSQIPSLLSHCLLVPIGMIVMAGVPTPGGLGGGEAAYAWLYKRLGADQAYGILGCLVQRAINWALGLIGYIIYLRTKRVVITDPASTRPV